MTALQDLIKAINQHMSTEKEKEKQLKSVETLAKKVIKEKQTLNISDSDDFLKETPLEAAIKNRSVDVFALLIKLGADPFYKPDPDKRSVFEKLTDGYFAPFRGDPDTPEARQYEWLMKDKDSPIFTWEKLKNNKPLYDEFILAGLIPKKQFINELPIHVAIKNGRMDLVDGIIKAAGSIQKAGDLNRMGLLSECVFAFLKGQKTAFEILKFLIKQGAGHHTMSNGNIPAIFEALIPKQFVENATEEDVLKLVNALLENGTPIDIHNPHSGYNLLMSAWNADYQTIFDVLLNKADATILNHKAWIEPTCLLFQLFDEQYNRLKVKQLLPKLKEKGLKFDQTINHRLILETTQVSNMSILHYYVSKLGTGFRGNALYEIAEHLEIIQALIANGANPNVKATFTSASGASVEYTAAEYARAIVNKIIDSYGGSPVAHYKDEYEFLQSNTYSNKRTQTSEHIMFHQFRNLERALSGKKPLPYSGLPDIGKITKLSLTKQAAAIAPQPADFNPEQYTAKLTNARTHQKQDAWKSHKKDIVDYVKNAGTLQDFLERVEQFKKPLQLHYDVNTNAKGEVINYGSTLYRFFHYFDPYKLPTSWEAIRKYGQDSYGIDINTEYTHQVSNPGM